MAKYMPLDEFELPVTLEPVPATKWWQTASLIAFIGLWAMLWVYVGYRYGLEEGESLASKGGIYITAQPDKVKELPNTPNPPSTEKLPPGIGEYRANRLAEQDSI